MTSSKFRQILLQKLPRDHTPGLSILAGALFGFRPNLASPVNLRAAHVQENPPVESTASVQPEATRRHPSVGD